MKHLMVPMQAKLSSVAQVTMSLMVEEVLTSSSAVAVAILLMEAMVTIF